MRRSLGSLLLTALLTLVVMVGVAGCGSTGSDTASDPGSDRPPASTSGTPSDGSSDSGSSEPRTVAMLSQSNAGGEVDPTPTVLDGPEAVASFAGQFDDGGNLQARLTRTVDRAEPGPGQVLAASVVSIGCDVPPGVEIKRVGGELRVTAQAVKSPRQECFVPVTTVAVVAVDSDWT